GPGSADVLAAFVVGPARLGGSGLVEVEVVVVRLRSEDPAHIAVGQAENDRGAGLDEVGDELGQSTPVGRGQSLGSVDDEQIRRRGGQPGEIARTDRSAASTVGGLIACEIEVGNLAADPSGVFGQYVLADL